MHTCKKALALLLALLMLAVLAPAAAFAANDRYVVYAQMPADWAGPCLWAWADDGANAFAAWPGGEMEADPADPGWYYCWLPASATNVIVNANEGSVQTADHKLEGKNTWLTITGPEEVEVSTEAKTTGEAPEYVETFAIHAQVPDDWATVNLWAWSAPDGKNAFEAWPGKPMKAGENGWYTGKAPIWVNSLIINGNEGKVQTTDLSIDAAEVWVTVKADGSADFTYNDPTAPVAENITVRVKAPADWAAPCLWAWSAPDGTNAFSAWPGEPLKAGDDGWLALEVPGWVNSIIVNGNAGGVQTTDLAVDVGKDVWITVTDAENAAVSYEQPAEAAPAPASAPAASEPAAAPQAPGPNLPLIIGLVAVVLLLAVAGGVYFAKKKKS